MKVAFVSSGNSLKTISPIIKAQGDSLSRLGLDIEYVPIEGKGLWGYLKNIPAIKRKIKIENADIVHAHFSFSAFAASLAGAKPDAIIMHHSQIPSGYEEHNGVPIFYSIGNLLHMTKNQKMHTGVLVSLTVSKTAKLDYEIIPIRFNMQQMKISMMLDVEKSSFIERLDELSEIVKNDKRLEQEWKKLVEHKRYTYLLSILGINPLLGRLLRKLRLSGVLSMLAVLKKKQLLALQNIMQCAIHREISIAMLEDLFGDKE